jgi:DNA polymerase-1
MSTWSVDTEFGWRGAEVPSAFVPVVFCAINVDTADRVHFWGRDRRLGPWVDAHRDDLFLAHSLIAEAKYLLQLDVQPPGRWFDTLLAFRYHTNREYPPKAKLTAALAELGLPCPYTDEEKEQLQEWIGGLHFDPASQEDRHRIREYCFSDCEGSIAIYRRLAPQIPEKWMDYAVRFSLATARSELRGIPIDVPAWTRLREHKEEIVARVIDKTNARHRVFTDGRLDKGRFLRWCASEEIGWPLERSPRTGKKYLAFDRRTFERMVPRHPFLGEVYETNRTITQLNDREIAVDPVTGRHHFTNLPFAQKASRTSLLDFLLGGPKWQRFFAALWPGMVFVSADYKAQEICIAAYSSGDGNMMKGYLDGDPHMGFAILAGAAPEGANAEDPRYAKVRKRYKAVNLAINYGQTPYGLAQSLGVPYAEARKLWRQHTRAYPVYWEWTKRYVSEAFRRGRCYTRLGWPRKVTRLDNHRSVANFAVQGCGADLMRLGRRKA